MKLIGIMSLESDIQQVKEIFEKYDVQIFSEIAIKGHTRSTLQEHGWWPSAVNVPLYSTLCFAVIDKLRADEIMEEIARNADTSPSEHPIRAFKVDVENMV